MKTIKKGKTIWIALICSLLLHVFFIRYIDNIFARLPVDKTFKKQSVAYIALGQKNGTITPVGNPDIQKYVELIETQNSGNQDIDETKLISKKPFLKNMIPEEITNEVQSIKVDKKATLFSSETILPPNIRKQADTLIKKETKKDIFPEKNIDESEKLSEEIPAKILQSIKEIRPEKKIVQKQEEEVTVEVEIIEENLPVRFPEENMISKQQISEKPEKKPLPKNLKKEKEILDFTGQLYTGGVTPPALKEYEKPSYPEFLREREIEGKVMLDVMLNRNGRVEEIKIYKSSGYYAFDEAAIQSVLKWRFKPAGKAGKDMASRVIIPVCFQIK